MPISLEKLDELDDPMWDYPELWWDDHLLEDEWYPEEE